MRGDTLLQGFGGEAAAADPLARVRKLRAEVRSLTLEPAAARNPLAAVRRILVIGSASRSGSSLLVKQLSQQPGFYTLIGESMTFLRLHNLAGRGEDSDEIFHEAALTPISRRMLAEDLRCDMVVPARPLDVADAGQWLTYVGRLLLRLQVQWPATELPQSMLLDLLVEDKNGVMRGGARKSPHHLYLALAEILYKTCGVELQLNHYDVGRVRSDSSLEPPHPWLLVEEPPFEFAPLCEAPCDEDLESGCLILKCPADSYRLGWIKLMFPMADLHYLHLVRNPAASINGLMDGWLSNGFFSRRFSEDRLRIQGYSERNPAGSQWWKFDLPPGWEAVASAPLADVCAFQWMSNNAALLAHPDFAATALRVTYDDLLTPTSRHAMFGRIAELVGLPRPIPHTAAATMPLVQATEPPVPGRWRRRESAILEALRRARSSDVADKLGYHVEEHCRWK